ncbi:MAG: hypothetical protein M1839_009101 [Geoglossum umbratile]|nr:MAG: hypothetical protein M1839_009101 [Geoglossum umbratile]
MSAAVMVPSTTTPLFYFPYSYADPGYARTAQTSQQCVAQDGHEHLHQEDDLDSDEEEDGCLARRHQSVNNLSASNATRVCPRNVQQHQLKMNISTALPMPKPQGPNSTTSSADGYESFENTNNKKKRKIPTPGNANGHHSHLSADLANLGISSPSEAGRPPHDDPDNGGGQHYSSGNATASSGPGNGISGSGYGRGRATRRGYSGKLVANYGGRSPLGVSTNGLNGLSSGHTALQRERVSPLRPQHRPSIANTATATEPESQGIISAAIARTAEKRIELPAKGQENVSLLHQQPPKTLPNKAQFTFTYESPLLTTINFSAEERGRRAIPAPVSSTEPAKPRMAMRGGHPGPGPGPGPGYLSRGMATQGTQTSPDMASAAGRPAQGPESSTQNPGNQTQTQQPPGTNQPTAQQQKKSRPRRTGKEYALAAGRRRLQQEYNNYHNPPTSSDDIWICEFCEYESIFGEPPEALMRQYEIKDRKERRRLAEKRRLLEKAKLKGRKGKKGSKTAPKNSGTAATSQQQQHPTDQGQTHSQSTEECMADEVEDEAVLTTAPQASTKSVYGGVQHSKSLTKNPVGPGHSGTAVCAGGRGTAMT